MENSYFNIESRTIYITLSVMYILETTFYNVYHTKRVQRTYYIKIISEISTTPLPPPVKDGKCLLVVCAFLHDTLRGPDSRSRIQNVYSYAAEPNHIIIIIIMYYCYCYVILL